MSISVITFGWVQQQTHPKVMRYAQLTRGTFIINDFLQNPHFNYLSKYLLILRHQNTVTRSIFRRGQWPRTLISISLVVSNKRLRNIERLRPVVLFPTRQILVCIVILLTRGLTNGQQQYNLRFLPKTDRQFYQKTLWIIMLFDNFFKGMVI